MSRNGGSGQQGSKEKVKGFFRKFKENRNEDARAHGGQYGQTHQHRSVSSTRKQREGASSLVTQNQQLVKTNLPVLQQGGGRNFSPAVPSEYEALLPPVLPHFRNKNCLVLDLDETLVHSSFKPVQNPDIILPIDIDGTIYQVYVRKRPYVDHFIRAICGLFEIVIFTASLPKYADPLLDDLDPGRRYMGSHRLFREHCSHTNGAYVKDLSLMGRPLHKICIIDNSPVAYLFQPRNALPCTSWFDDPNDTELRDFLSILERMATCESVYEVLDEYHMQLANSEN